MYISAQQLQAFEARYGAPRMLRVQVPVGADELAMVRASRKNGRRHDFTVFALEGNQVVVIHKPFHPPGVYRAPSGGVKPGEGIVEGTLREMHEETGLLVALDKYLLRIEARFVAGEESEEWVSHVITAHMVGGRLSPIDTHEIAEARWVSLAELQGPIRQALLASGRGLLAYRAMLTDQVVDMLRPGRSAFCQNRSD